MTRTVAFIQARVSSTRLPGKVLESVQGVPLIVFMVRRVQRARSLDAVVVVTSTDASDDVLAETLGREGLPVFRGDLNDVLKRYADAAAAHDADVVIRLTGDCPLIDPAVVDAVVDVRRHSQADYASNIDPPTFPDGVDVECFTREVLQRANAEAVRPSEREHVTLWMRSDEANLSRANYSAPVDMSGLRLTVDYADDLALVRALVDKLGAGAFDLFDVLRLMTEQSSLRDANQHQRNEGLAKSLREEGSLEA